MKWNPARRLTGGVAGLVCPSYVVYTEPVEADNMQRSHLNLDMAWARTPSNRESP